MPNFGSLSGYGTGSSLTKLFAQPSRQQPFSLAMAPVPDYGLGGISGGVKTTGGLGSSSGQQVSNVDPESPFYNGPASARKPATPNVINGAAAAANANPAVTPMPSIDYSADPILQKIKALNQMNVQDAESNAGSLKKQELIQHGYDPSFDQTGATKALFPDESTLTAAQDNPFSVLAQLKYGNTQHVNSLEDALNKSNLYYGSYRGDQLGNAGHDFQLALAQANQQRDSVLGGINSGLLEAKRNAAMGDLQGELEAYLLAIQNGIGGGGGGGGGGGSDDGENRTPNFPIPVAKTGRSPLLAALAGAPLGMGYGRPGGY